MKKDETAIFTNMCMIYDGENVLVQERTDPSWPGIAFPGGHVENGEPFTDAVIREIFEETGLTISSLQICGIKDWIRDDGTRYVVFLYKTSDFFGTLRNSDEGKVMWVPIREISKMKLSKSMKSTLKLFFEDTLTEQFFHKINNEWKETIK